VLGGGGVKPGNPPSLFGAPLDLFVTYITHLDVDSKTPTRARILCKSQRIVHYATAQLGQQKHPWTLWLLGIQHKLHLEVLWKKRKHSYNMLSDFK